MVDLIYTGLSHPVPEKQNPVLEVRIKIVVPSVFSVLL